MDVWQSAGSFPGVLVVGGCGRANSSIFDSPREIRIHAPSRPSLSDVTLGFFKIQCDPDPRDLVVISVLRASPGLGTRAAPWAARSAVKFAVLHRFTAGQQAVPPHPDSKDVQDCLSPSPLALDKEACWACEVPPPLATPRAARLRRHAATQALTVVAAG